MFLIFHQKLNVSIKPSNLSFWHYASFIVGVYCIKQSFLMLCVVTLHLLYS